MPVESWSIALSTSQGHNMRDAIIIIIIIIMTIIIISPTPEEITLQHRESETEIAYRDFISRLNK